MAKESFPAAHAAPFRPIGRIPIVDVSPCIENGSWPAKGTVGESFPVQATVFREGHDLLTAECVLVNPQGKEVQCTAMRDVSPGLDRYEGWLTPTAPGAWEFFVRARFDPYGTWKRNAQIKMETGTDLPLIFLEAEQILKRALKSMPRGSEERRIVREAAAQVGKKRSSAETRFAAATSGQVAAALARYPLPEGVSVSPRFRLNVDRIRALVGSWYEIFPRTVGAKYNPQTKQWTSGTLRTAAEDLPRIRAMGFDVIYLTPIHPIGTTYRKGRNNCLKAGADDPGSPYAVGSEDGGHDAIHPALGTFGDFDFFVSRAREEGMEVALDLALQCSPDHPWVKSHPEWFTQRADGTIAYAENPPKKYQDIYPLNFDRDPEGLYREIKKILELWIKHGVTIFRVDNPHTKPLNFWQRLLGDFRKTHPDVIFLAEAFTRPPMMQTLGKIGFHQSYTYFAWRNEKHELESYLWEVSHLTSPQMRPAFWPTTHDILTPYMQRGGIPAYAIRAVLAATGSPTWGIYSGYELIENIARPGAEEPIDNEKYEFKLRNFLVAKYNGMETLLTMLNDIRSRHTALRRLRNVTVHPTSDDKILCFSKTCRPEENGGKADRVIVAVNLDPYASREAVIDLNIQALGLCPRPDPAPVMEVYDEMSGNTYLWNARPYVRLDPHGQVAHIMSVRPLQR